MPLEKKKILVVDDDRALVTNLCIILTRMGLNVFPADNGLEALRLMKIVTPDLVILDVDMPMMDGVKTLQWIKDDKKLAPIPVIMVSGDGLGESARKCRELGCADFLARPLRVDELHYLIEEHIFSRLGWKRKYIRAYCNCTVTVEFGGETYELFTESVSEGGAFIRKVDPFPAGSELRIKLPLDGSRVLDLKGTVIYTKGLYGDEFVMPPGMAVEFMPLSDEDAKALMEHVSRLVAGDAAKDTVAKTAPEERLQNLPRQPK